MGIGNVSCVCLTLILMVAIAVSWAIAACTLDVSGDLSLLVGHIK